MCAFWLQFALQPVQTSKRYAFRLLWPWPWPDDLDIWTWLTHSEDVPAHKTELSRSSCSTVRVRTMTDRQTQPNALPRRICGRYLMYCVNATVKCCKPLIFCIRGNRLSLRVWWCVLAGRWRHWLIIINTWRLQLNNSDITPQLTYKQTSCCLMQV